MKKVILLIIFTQFAFSQVPSIQWQKCIGGNNNDNIQSIDQTSDGGYIVAGYSNSTDGSAIGNHGSNDILIVKLNAFGDIEWNKMFGGSSYDRVNKILQSSDGGYVFSGFTYSNDGNVSGNHGDSDVWIAKLNSIGELIWQKTYGGSNQDIGNEIIENSDGFIVAAQTFSNNGNVSGNHGTTDAWLLKLDFLGNLIWKKCFGGSNFDSAVSIQQTQDGGFIFTGSTSSNNGDVTGNHGTLTTDYWVVKISTTGIIQWQKCLGGTSNEEATCIQQTSQEGFIISGYTSSNDGDVIGFNGNKDYWIVKLDELGNILWGKSIGGTGEDYAFKVKQTNDNGFIVSGYTGSNDGDVLFNHSNSIPSLDIWVVKLNINGDEVWQKSLGSVGYQDCHDVQQTSDGGFIIAGNTGAGNTGDVTGFIGGNLDFWVVKLDPDYLSNFEFEKNNIILYPNPTENFLYFNSLKENIKSVSIIDSQGRKIYYTLFDNKIDISNLKSGIYFLEIWTYQNNVVTKKIIKK